MVGDAGVDSICSEPVPFCDIESFWGSTSGGWPLDLRVAAECKATRSKISSSCPGSIWMPSARIFAEESGIVDEDL